MFNTYLPECQPHNVLHYYMNKLLIMNQAVQNSNLHVWQCVLKHTNVVQSLYRWICLGNIYILIYIYIFFSERWNKHSSQFERHGCLRDISYIWYSMTTALSGKAGFGFLPIGGCIFKTSMDGSLHLSDVANHDLFHTKSLWSSTLIRKYPRALPFNTMFSAILCTSLGYYYWYVDIIYIL